MEDAGVSSSQFEDFVVSTTRTNEATELKVSDFFFFLSKCYANYGTFKVEVETFMLLAHFLDLY